MIHNTLDECLDKNCTDPRHTIERVAWKRYTRFVDSGVKSNAAGKRIANGYLKHLKKTWKESPAVLHWIKEMQSAYLTKI